jgi:hypothetical protein
MSADKIITIAQTHIGGAMESSARLCLTDAIYQLNKGDTVAAKHRALKSLAYSVGILHPDYRAAVN